MSDGIVAFDSPGDIHGLGQQGAMHYAVFADSQESKDSASHGNARCTQIRFLDTVVFYV